MSEFLLRVPNLFQEKCGERWKFNDLTAGGYGNLCFCIADYGWGVQGGCCYKQWFVCFMSCTPSIDMGSKAPKVRKSDLKEWKMLVFWGENHWIRSFCSVEMTILSVQKTPNYYGLVSSEIKKCLFTYIFHLGLLYCVAKGVQFLTRTRDARAFPSNFAFLLSQPSHKWAVACDKFS